MTVVAESICVCGHGYKAHLVRNGYCPLSLEGRWRPGCETCRGSGKVIVTKTWAGKTPDTGGGSISQHRCDDCAGTGRRS